MSDRRPPAGLVGIPRSLQSLATPTLPASEAVAVLVPPTGNGVLNQIPAGDGRESSREQAVPDEGVSIHRGISSRGRETISPL